MNREHNIDTIMEGEGVGAREQHVFATTCIMDDSGLCSVAFTSEHIRLYFQMNL